MALKNEIQNRWQVVRDTSKPLERRLFAGLELICAPISFVTLLLFLPTLVILEWFQATDAQGLVWVMRIQKVLMAAAIGYVTNFIAIQMLFKPFRPEHWHPLTLLTFGYWRQGLIPRNKNQLGVEIGHQVEEKLLDPRQISSELCGTALDFLHQPCTLLLAREKMQMVLKSHQEEITAFLVPQVEESLIRSVHQLLNDENIEKFWQEFVEPQLSSESVRQMIAEKIATGLRKRAPQFMVTLREMVREYVTSFLEKTPFLGSFGMAGGLAGSFMAFVNWKEVEDKIEKKLREPETIRTLGEELLDLGNQFRTWLDSTEGAASVENCRTSLQGRIRTFIRDYLHENIPLWLECIQESPQLWSWIEKEALPTMEKQIEEWMRTDGQALLVEKLHLARRVQEAVEKQDVEEFYQMIEKVAAQHLGAIQVLGFLLGGVVGLIQLML